MSQPVFDITVTREIAAPPERLYDLLTDLSRVGELSPEAVSARWVEGDGPAVGARFKGRNKLGRFVSWTTVCTVRQAEPGRRFVFETSAPSRTTWSYTFEPVAGGTRVTEAMTKDHEQPAPIRALQRLAGVSDRQAHLRSGMTTTLANLDRLAATVSS